MKIGFEYLEEFISFGNRQFPENIKDKGDCWDFELDSISIRPNIFTHKLCFSSYGTCRGQWGDHENIETAEIEGKPFDVNLTPKHFLKLEGYYDEMIEWADENDYEITDVEFIFKGKKKSKELIVRFTVETETTIDTWDYIL